MYDLLATVVGCVMFFGGLLLLVVAVISTIKGSGSKDIPEGRGRDMSGW